MADCSVAPSSCNSNALNSATVQTKIWRQFLCLLLKAGVPATDCSVSALLTASEGWICQGSPSKLRLLQVQQMCADLDIDCEAFDCLTPLQEEAIISYLVCALINYLND